MRGGLRGLYRGARGLASRLPRPAREALRRLAGRPPSDWAGSDFAHWAAAAAPSPEPENRHEVVCFGTAASDSGPEHLRVLVRRLAAAGHRVFRIGRPFLSAGPAFTLHEEPAGLFTVSLRAGDKVGDRLTGEETSTLFGAIDALRREKSLGATISIVGEAFWMPVAERLRTERAWPQVEGARDPEDLVRAFPKISIVIVTYNNRDLNRLCLESLAARTEWPNTEVIVVDNASTDGTRELLQEMRRRDPRLRLILHEKNVGFAAASNAGLAVASGEYLVLLNNDTVLTRGWASALARHLGDDPRLGLVGPVTNAIANTARVDVGYTGLRDLPAWAAAWTRAHDQETFEIPMLALFCAALRRSVFEQVGALDERFGIGMFEDDDYSRRVRQAGYAVRCAKDAFVHHWQMASFRKMARPEYLALFRENRRKYEEKWGEAPAAADPFAGDAPRPKGLAGGREQLAAVLARVGASRGAVLFLPSIGWGTHLFQRPHHLARVFARKGYVSIFDTSNARDRVDGFQEIEPNLFLFGGAAALLREIPKPLLWAFPYNFHLAGAYPSGTRVVYDWIDDLSVFPGSRRILMRNHERALREASLVAAAARRLHDEALAARKDALYLPNAVEYAQFASPASLPNDEALGRFLAGGGPVAGYYGALAKWFDDDLLEQAARLRPDWRFVLIGPQLDIRFSEKRVLERSNVLWLGPRDYAALPGYLSVFDVAMIPFRINAITLATSPLKLYEYFAGARPVVATPMPECMAYPEVAIARDAEGFVAALDRMRAQGKDPAFRERLRALGRENSWDARVESVEARLAR